MDQNGRLLLKQWMHGANTTLPNCSGSHSPKIPQWPVVLPWNGLPSPSGRVVLLQHVCWIHRLHPLTVADHVYPAAAERAQSPAAIRVCFQIWESGQWCSGQSGQADLTKSPGRSPFWCRFFLYTNGSISSRSSWVTETGAETLYLIVWIVVRRLQRRYSWRCGSPHVGRTETMALGFWWLTKSSTENNQIPSASRTWSVCAILHGTERNTCLPQGGWTWSES